MEERAKKRIQKQIEDGSIYTKKKYKSWREKVLARDNYKCQMPRCKKNTDILNVHHIHMKYYYPELIYDVSNGITLCKNCHFKIHRRKSDKRLIPRFERTVRKNTKE